MRVRTNLILYVLATVLAIALTAACSIPTVPEKVNIKASPTYEVPAGTTTITLSDHFDLDTELIAELETELGEDGTASGSVVNDIYTIFASYIPVSMNTADFFNEEINLVDSVNQTIEPITFTVPEINETSTVTEDIDPIALPATVSLPETPVNGLPEAPDTTVTLGDSTAIEIPATGFDTVTFSQGSLDAELSFADLSGNVSVSNVSIVDPNDSYNVLSTADDISGSGNNSTPITVTFPLAGVQLPSTIAFSLTIDIDSSGEIGTFNLNINPSFTGSPTLQAATGVDFDITETGDKLLEIEDPNLVYADIGVGNLGADIILPAGWSGIDVDLILSVYQALDTSSSLVSSDDNDDGNVNLDLAGLEFGEGAIGPTLGWEYTITGTNASFSISATEPEATITNNISITRFNNLDVLAPELDLSANEVTENYIIDQDIIDMVNSIGFSLSELQFDIDNGLPFAVTINADSNILSTSPDSLTFNSETAGLQRMEIVDFLDMDQTSGTYSLATGIIDSEGTTGDGIHMEFSFDIDSYDEATQELSLTGVDANTEYTFSGSVNAVLEIDSVDISEYTYPSEVEGPAQFPEAGSDPFDLSMLNDFLPANVNLYDSGNVAQMVLNGPDGLALEIVLLAQYTDSSNNLVVEELLIDASTAENPDTPVFDASLYTGYTLDRSAEIPTTNSASIDLLTILNQRPNDLRLAYQIKINSLLIEEIQNIESNDQTISASLEIALPMAIDVEDNDEIADGWLNFEFPDQSIQDELIVQNDLLDRDVVPDPDVSDILNNLTEASIHLDLVNEMFREIDEIGGDSLMIRIVDGENLGGDTYPFDKSLDFSTGLKELSLDQDDVDYIRDNPFTPEIKLYLKEGVLRFNPDAELSIGLWLRVRTDIDHTFEL